MVSRPCARTSSRSANRTRIIGRQMQRPARRVEPTTPVVIRAKPCAPVTAVPPSSLALVLLAAACASSSAKPPICDRDALKKELPYLDEAGQHRQAFAAALVAERCQLPAPLARALEAVARRAIPAWRMSRSTRFLPTRRPFTRSSR